MSKLLHLTDYLALGQIIANFMQHSCAYEPRIVLARKPRTFLYKPELTREMLHFWARDVNPVIAPGVHARALLKRIPTGQPQPIADRRQCSEKSGSAPYSSCQPNNRSRNSKIAHVFFFQIISYESSLIHPHITTKCRVAAHTCTSHFQFIVSRQWPRNKSCLFKSAIYGHTWARPYKNLAAYLLLSNVDKRR